MSDFTYVATWIGLVYVAFVIDVYVRCVVGWRAAGHRMPASCWMRLKQALHERRPTKGGGLIRHSDRGSQYVSIKYTECLAPDRALGRQRRRQL